MENKIIISKIDELMARKIHLERVLKQSKEQTEDKMMLLLGGTFDDELETKLSGQIILVERWIKDIESEIDSLVETE